MARIKERMGRALRGGRYKTTNDVTSVEEADEIEVGNRKRKRQDSASPLSRLIESCRRSSNHWSPVGWIHICSIERLVWQGRGYVQLNNYYYYYTATVSKSVSIVTRIVTVCTAFEGLRRVRPYIYDFVTHAKQRWLGKKVIDVFCELLYTFHGTKYAVVLPGTVRQDYHGSFFTRNRISPSHIILEISTKYFSGWCPEIPWKYSIIIGMLA